MYYIGPLMCVRPRMVRLGFSTNKNTKPFSVCPNSVQGSTKFYFFFFLLSLHQYDVMTLHQYDGLDHYWKYYTI